MRLHSAVGLIGAIPVAAIISLSHVHPTEAAPCVSAPGSFVKSHTFDDVDAVWNAQRRRRAPLHDRFL